MPCFLLGVLAALAAAAQPLPRLAHFGAALELANGALVIAQLRPAGNAAAAGLQPGDVILTVDGRPAPAETAFARALLRRPDGTQATLQIRRGARQLDITLQYNAPPRENPAGIDVVYGSLEVDNHRRRTLLTKPKNHRRPPVILWLAGSGCGTQESPTGASPEVQLMYALTRAGYATLRVEKTGTGDSEGPPCYGPEGDIGQEVRAYAAAIAQLRPARIFLFGHSAGATIAPLVLQAAGPVEGVIAAGGMGTRFQPYMLEMRERDFALAGKNVAAEMAITTRCLHALFDLGQSPDEIETAMPNCRRRVRFDSPPAYIADWAKLDLAALWRDAPRVPVLVLYGTGDFVSSLHQSRTLTALIPKARLQTLPMDHSFLAYATPEAAYAAEQGKPPTPPRLQTEAVAAVLQFLKRHR